MDDLIKLGAVILFIVVPLILQVIKGARRPQAGQKPRPQPRPRPLPQANVQPGGKGALHNEIDAFLRRAAHRRGAGPVQDVEIVEPDVIEAASRPLARPLSEVEVVPTEPALGDGVTAHVKQHIQTDDIQRHTQQLGAAVEHADEKLEGHLHRVFDRDIGSLHDTSTESPHDESIREGTDAAVWQSADAKRKKQKESSPQQAAEIAAMLRDPSSLKDAIILAEIFRRPEDRF